MNHCVYKLISPSDHVYVGITKNLKLRMRSHAKLAGNKYMSRHKKKHGYTFDDFRIVIHKDNLTRKEALNLEQEMILEFEEQGKSLNYHRRSNVEHKVKVEMPNGEVSYV